jgi:hypothetical protein
LEKKVSIFAWDSKFKAVYNVVVSWKVAKVLAKA